MIISNSSKEFLIPYDAVLNDLLAKLGVREFNTRNILVYAQQAKASIEATLQMKINVEGGETIYDVISKNTVAQAQGRNFITGILDSLLQLSGHTIINAYTGDVGRILKDNAYYSYSGASIRNLLKHSTRDGESQKVSERRQDLYVNASNYEIDDVKKCLIIMAILDSIGAYDLTGIVAQHLVAMDFTAEVKEGGSLYGSSTSVK